jgi:thymidylate synthase
VALIQARDELDALGALLEHILSEGTRTGNYLEVTNLLLEIAFDEASWGHFCSFKERYLEIAGTFGRTGWKRATRVYTETVDRPSKPSYRRRLVDFPDTPRRGEPGDTINQLDKIASLLASKPGYSNLSFVVLRPADLFDQFRPGYVPCPIAGDFKLRDGRLGLSVMFRTNDALSVAYADIHYLRLLQMEVLEAAQSRSAARRLHCAQVGNLYLYFSRAYIEKSKRLKPPRLSECHDRPSPATDGLGIAQQIIDEIRKARGFL